MAPRLAGEGRRDQRVEAVFCYLADLCSRLRERLDLEDGRVVATEP